jgi:diguanylate cyclase (GGDEF)-like protein
MSWQYSSYAVVLHIAAFISIIVAILAWRNREVPGATILAFMMLAMAEWSTALAFENAIVGIENKIFWSKVEYFGSLLTPTLFLLFALEYTQLTSLWNTRTLALFFILPLIGLLIVWTNAWHGWIWTGFAPSHDYPNTIVYIHGPGFYFLWVFEYLMVLGAIAALLRGWRSYRQLYRRQVGVILLSAVLPILGGLSYCIGLNPFPGLETAPLCFTLSGLIIAFDILKFRLFNQIPVARDLLFEYITDGLLVLDPDQRIIDINPAAQKLINLPAIKVLNQQAETVLGHVPELVRAIKGHRTTKTDVRLDTTPPRYYDLRISPLYTKRHKYIGQLLILRDVSEQHKTELALSQSNEETTIINRISLSITSGLEMTQVVKALHKQCSHVAPIDIFYVALYDEQKSLINIPIYYEHGRYHIGQLRDISEHPGILGNVIARRRTIYLRDSVNPITRPIKEPPKDGQREMSFVGIPLITRDRVVGVMAIQNYQANAYLEEQIRLLERIAVHAAIAIENARLYSEVQRLAIVDELTGIYNYRGLLELGSREVERAQRFSRPLSLLFFDLDDFRNFNNTYSHATGNVVLKNVVVICQNLLRSVDILTRYGGDEFVAILPETNLTDAENVAIRLAKEVAENPVSTPHGLLSVTISIGVTSLTAKRSSLSALLERANQAEHQAKKDKKGIVIVAS